MKTVLNIDGMSCAHCVRHVTEALVEIGGVESVQVSLEDQTAVVDHEECVTLADLEEAISEAGYEVV